MSEWREILRRLALQGKLDDNSRLDVVKFRASLTCFRFSFFPGRAKDLAAPRLLKLKGVGLPIRSIADDDWIKVRKRV